MEDIKPLYRSGKQYAIEHGELSEWRESYRANCDCAKFVERSIAENYQENRLDCNIADMISQVGTERLEWILANSVQQKSYDGRFSPSNKRWAESFALPKDDSNRQFCVESHPCLVDGLIGQLRQYLAMQSLNERLANLLVNATTLDSEIQAFRHLHLSMDRQSAHELTPAYISALNGSNQCVEALKEYFSELTDEQINESENMTMGGI